MSSRTDPTLLLLSVLDHLRRNPHGVDLHELAALYDLTPNQLRHYVDLLWTVGVIEEDGFQAPDAMFDFDAAGLEEDPPWLRLTHDPAGTRPRRFTPDELANAQLGLQVLRASADTDDLGPIDALLARFRRDGAPASVLSDDPVLAGLRSALADGRRIRLNYRGEDATVSEWRTVDPIGIDSRGSLHYLNAWCYLRGGPRWFRTDRILDLELTEEPARPHPELTDRTMFAAQRTDLIVELRVGPTAVSALRPYLPSPRLPAPDEHDQRRVTVRFRSLRILQRLVAEHAEEIEVLAPQSIRERLAEWAENALALLDGGTEPSTT